MGAEQAHRFAVVSAKWGISPKDRVQDEACLRTQLWGKELSNPVGLAAGFDKDAECVDGMFGAGFGLVEVGSITPLAQPGNPQPRMFRLPEDRACINRYGFNSRGHAYAEQVLQHRRATRSSPSSSLEEVPRSLKPGRLLGVNLGKNKVSGPDDHSDYVKGVERFGPLADYLVINVSSPNTPGLRSLQARESLDKLIGEVMHARNALSSPQPPLVLKIAPDLDEAQMKDIASVALAHHVDGIIVSNTTITRPDSLKSRNYLVRETGGLSGPPVKPLSLACLRQMYKMTQGKITLIGCGGIRTGEDALEFGRAGASVIQLYTSMAYDGLGVVREVKDDIARGLNGRSWSDIVGEDVRKSFPKA
ncbi:Dihydroorotate dehydrogenase [Piptocephalis cylindrospora]|uniref:Dihydroorotate dehydrogenase (quinone), mitochondrial n=1 Tax=Piptocephalis cylindrospora TaxID=1907219 RepID=A0A4P9Y0J4_9FUNG|nr:Dihydroorotate dehydrogenase [Piptocephalis cylindrospora]|eukprot:RKP12275.1 Dihydroorotate dehydrogenase [Piptocephalis cylindrospora]